MGVTYLLAIDVHEKDIWNVEWRELFSYITKLHSPEYEIWDFTFNNTFCVGDDCILLRYQSLEPDFSTCAIAFEAEPTQAIRKVLNKRVKTFLEERQMGFNIRWIERTFLDKPLKDK